MSCLLHLKNWSLIMGICDLNEILWTFLVMAYLRSDNESLFGLPLTLDKTFFDQLWKYYLNSCGASLWMILMIESISENILPSFYYINQFEYKQYANNINEKIKTNNSMFLIMSFLHLVLKIFISQVVFIEEGYFYAILFVFFNDAI